MKRNYNLTEANAKLKDLRERGWKPGMDKQWFEGEKCENWKNQYAHTLEQIAEIIYHEGLTPHRVTKSAVQGYIRTAMKKIRRDLDVKG